MTLESAQWFEAMKREAEANPWTPRDVDWSLPHNSEPPPYIRLAWARMEPRLPAADLEHWCREHYKWTLDQNAKGEMIGLYAASRLMQLCDTDETVWMAGRIGAEEALHAEGVQRLAKLLPGKDYPVHSRVKETVDECSETLAGALLGLHIGERFGDACYPLRAKYGGPLFKAVFAGVIADEKRHLGFGKYAIRQTWGDSPPKEVSAQAQRIVDGFASWADPSEMWDHNWPEANAHWAMLAANSRQRRDTVYWCQKLGLDVT